MPVGWLALAGLLALPQSSAVRSQEIASPSNPQVSAAWDVLKQGLADNDVEHRKNAIAAIGTIGPNEEAVHLVERGLQDKDADARQTAAETLGEMKARSAIPNLKAALDDAPEVSFTAARALWDLGDTSGRTIFQEVLEGERSGAPNKLKGAAKAAKKKLQPGQLALMGVKEASGALLGPASLGIVATEQAVKLLKKDGGAAGRSIAAEVLGKDSDPYALTLLEWALDDDNWGVRVSIAKALGDRGNEATITKLEPLLKDDRHAVRYMAAASIVKISSKRSIASNN